MEGKQNEKDCYYTIGYIGCNHTICRLCQRYKNAGREGAGRFGLSTGVNAKFTASLR